VLSREYYNTTFDRDKTLLRIVLYMSPVPEKLSGNSFSLLAEGNGGCRNVITNCVGIREMVKM
jgi:hypothetical protein